MAYGITSTSQIIDLNAIKAACAELKTALEDYEKSGKINEIKDIQIKIKRTQKYINYLMEIFKELNRSEDKLIEKIVNEYSLQLSKKLIEENPDYYNASSACSMGGDSLEKSCGWMTYYDGINGVRPLIELEQTDVEH